ncbi:MAG TPA: fatty acid desaturase CarF family protein [Polyangia bacterium]|nr:fatty acid desaturase CarF family protein [Polyangia bacterium]
MTYSRAHRRYELAALAAHLALSTALALRVAARLDGAASALALAAALTAGYLAADFASGVVHWLADRYGSTETWLFGENFVRSFREHHRDPEAITRHDFVETNGDSCIFVVPLLALVVLGARGSIVLDGFTLALGVAVLLTSQIHRWAHMPSPPRAVAWLQARRLILAPDRHRAHHAAPFNRHYCITTGWLNPLLDRARFFPRMERVLSAFGRRVAGEAERRDGGVHHRR